MTLLLRYRFEYLPEQPGEAPEVVVYLSLTPNRMRMAAVPRT